MKLGLGTVQFGMNYGISNEAGIVCLDEVDRILTNARNNHITLLDTAQAYGESEEQIGKVNSQDFKIITKLRPGIQANEIRVSVRNSILVLNRRILDGVLFHEFNDYYKNPQTLKNLDETKSEGLIRKTGFSLYLTEHLDFLLDNHIEFDILQIPFNIFDQRFKSYFKVLKEKRIEIQCRSVFLQGLVFLNPKHMKSHFNEYIPLFLKFHNKIRDLNSTVVKTCLNYVYSIKEIDHIIIGVCSNKELQMSLDSLSSKTFEMEKYHKDFQGFSISDEKIVLPCNWE